MEDERPEGSVESLKRRVDDAKLRFDFASAYVTEVDNDDRSGRIPPTYADARERAIRAQRSARDEYLRVLKIYEDFVARGKAAHNGAGSQAERESAGAQPDGEEP